MTQTCFRVNKSFESDSGDLRGANEVGQQDVGQRVVFGETIYEEGEPETDECATARWAD
jgi:hypothetical protein